MAMAENEAHVLAQKIEKYIKGSSAGIFDQKTNIEIKNSFTVFSIRDLADDLRPIAMYLMLDYIWTRIKKDRRERLLIIDEAWWMMQFEEGARFLHSIAKRARKYALGLTTITQDVEDFLGTDYGRAVVTNSSIQVLLKQSTAAADKLQKVFYLSMGEKQYLLTAGIGEGIFFAGNNHVGIQVIASENEHNLITTNPREMKIIEDANLEKVEKQRLESLQISPQEQQDLEKFSVPNSMNSIPQTQDSMGPRNQIPNQVNMPIPMNPQVNQTQNLGDAQMYTNNVLAPQPVTGNINTYPSNQEIMPTPMQTNPPGMVTTGQQTYIDPNQNELNNQIQPPSQLQQ